MSMTLKNKTDFFCVSLMIRAPIEVKLLRNVYFSCIIRGGSRTAATSKMELFVIMVNELQHNSQCLRKSG